MINNQKIEFLYQSITDTQATIRAIDMKIGFLFVVVFLPATELREIIKIYQVLKEISDLYFYLMIITAVIWALSAYTLFKSTISISDPKNYISGNLPKGNFYTSNLYSLNKIDYLFNFPIKSNQSIDEFSQDLPDNEERIINELSFEKLKITYIRDIKIKRSSLCGNLIFYWLLFGCILWTLYLLKVGF